MRDLAALRFDFPNQFEMRGIAICREFLRADELKSLNEEISEFLDRPSINGGVGAIFHANPYDHREVSQASNAIRAVNLIELALDVRDLFVREQPSLAAQNLKLTNLRLYSETGNQTPLFWHTDNRDGMLRAMVYLAGGGERSGAFQYMVGTHKRDYYVEHKLSEEQIHNFSDRIVNCVEPPGTLMLFDSVGFHAKKPCIENRRTIMLEFQPESLACEKSNVTLSALNLSTRVQKNIDFLANGVKADQRNHGPDVLALSPPPLPLKHAFQCFKTALRHELEQRFQHSAIKRALRKIKHLLLRRSPAQA